MTVTFKTLQSYFELWLQFVESCSYVIATFEILLSIFCSHNSKFHNCNFQQTAVIIRNLSAIFENLQSCDCNFWNPQSSDCNIQHLAVIIWNVTAKYRNLRSNFSKNPNRVNAFFENCSHFLNLLSYLWTLRFSNFCSHISKVAVTWLQRSTFRSHISNYDGKIFELFETISTHRCANEELVT